MTLHPFLLPHEWLAKAKDFNDFTQMMQSAKDNVDIWSHITTLAPGLHSPPTDFIPLGLHCDGVPFGSQVFYSDSLELFSLNFPCLHSGMRIPFTSVQRTHLVKHETYNAIFEVLSWSLKHLAFGTFPSRRHNDDPFGKREQFRSRLSSTTQPAKALLVEIRADWVALKQLFQFPQQNENAGICWMCSATPKDIRDCSLLANWRTSRKTAMSFHKQLLLDGKTCPLWSVPGVSSHIVIVDWLHCVDIGVAADVLGNVLLELVDQYPGSDRHVRMRNLWKDISDEYARQAVPCDNRFPGLRLKSFFVTSKSPKLKGKAAHIRYFVPVLDCIVQDKFPQDNIHNRTVVKCMHNLAECYSCLQDFNADKFEISARRLGSLHCALEQEKLAAGIQKRWKVKPKLHLSLELSMHLCLQRQRGNPRHFWTYADETHGGLMKTIAASRGGKNSSLASAYRLLTMWSAKTDLVSMIG